MCVWTGGRDEAGPGVGGWVGACPEAWLKCVCVGGGRKGAVQLFPSNERGAVAEMGHCI